MQLNAIKPRQALNKAWLKVKPNRTDIERFKSNLVHLLECTNAEESEEHNKNFVMEFLKKTWYDPGHFVNTKGRNDLVIHNGDTAKSAVGVIIEAKKPTNRAEMISTKKLNTKAFQELVLYYLRERITHNNLAVRHLVATNSNEWFVFDATLFERLFAQNKVLVQQFTDFEAGRLADTRTEFFYKAIAEPFIDSITAEVSFTYFNIQDYQKQLRNANRADDNALIALFKLLSPEHLLKQPFANDSNSLDKRFYSELLHIMGLTEVKEGGKKLIDRHQPGERHTGTLLEDAIIQLDSLDKLSRLQRPGDYGTTTQERLFSVALDLSLTWMNRVLFLKLLEAQLLTYHKGDKAYSFLDSQRIKSYDDLNSLFFQVLARPFEDRNTDVKKAFEKVPYLNSSLFEPTELEQTTLLISNLKDDKSIPIFSQTVLKDDRGKRRSGQLGTLSYLFAFLDAYDFSSEGSEDIQEDNKTLINASVLGLIFEKINGYKDGSFFTPGFITMYMCRETIRRAVVQKFNESKHWNCQSIEDLYDKIDNRKEANSIINSLKICDPAVGSGHFLVSALNELIAIKHDLKILEDRQGRRLKEYQVEVVNDELVITDEEGKLFEYHPGSTGSPKATESQRVQEALFHEKQTLIEHCLFGVDINANSVKICRLRLWIELLKNAYYKAPSPLERAGGEALETLPNIDINIKCGNSLVSRFKLDADLKQALKKSKYSIDGYRAAVDTYRNADSKEEKREMERLMAAIKADFRSEISLNDPLVKKLQKARGELLQLTTTQSLFELGKKEKAAWNKKVEQLSGETKKLEAEIDAIKANKIFEHAFEWRFEFPEVLNDDGDFIGFDVVIGNPPYISSKDFDKKLMSYLTTNYSTSQYQLDLYVAFIEKGVGILKSNGQISFITPNSWLKNMTFSNLRQFILDNIMLQEIFPNLSNIFEEASVDTLIVRAIKNKIVAPFSVYEFDNKIPRLKHNIIQERFFENNRQIFDVETNSVVFDIVKKIRQASVGLSDLCEITRGVNPYDKARGQSEDVISTKAYHSDTKKDATFLPEIRGKHVSTFSYKWDGKNFISYGSWLAAPREKKFFEGRRIIMRQVLGERFNCAIIDEDFIIDQSVFIAKPLPEFSQYSAAILGFLTSKLAIQFFKFSSNEFDALFPKIKIGEFRELPVPRDLESAQERLSVIVEKIRKEKMFDSNAHTKELEFELDQLVYQLYNLTEGEIAIIENA